jgi:hypothetical protein
MTADVPLGLFGSSFVFVDQLQNMKHQLVLVLRAAAAVCRFVRVVCLLLLCVPVL